MKGKTSIIALKALVENLHQQGDALCAARLHDESVPKFSFVFDARNLLDGKPNNVEESACTLARFFVDTERPADAERVLTTLITYLTDDNESISDEKLLSLYESLQTIQADNTDWLNAIETHRRVQELKTKRYGHNSREIAELFELRGRLFEHHAEACQLESFQVRVIREQAVEALIFARDIYHVISEEYDNADVQRVENLMHLMAMHLF